jgi:hypothetical protein
MGTVLFFHILKNSKKIENAELVKTIIDKAKELGIIDIDEKNICVYIKK